MIYENNGVTLDRRQLVAVPKPEAFNREKDTSEPALFDRLISHRWAWSRIELSFHSW